MSPIGTILVQLVHLAFSRLVNWHDVSACVSVQIVQHKTELLYLAKWAVIYWIGHEPFRKSQMRKSPVFNDNTTQFKSILNFSDQNEKKKNKEKSLGITVMSCRQ